LGIAPVHLPEAAQGAMALAAHELPRRFSPGLTEQQESTLAKNRSNPIFNSVEASQEPTNGRERFSAKAGNFVLLAYPGLKRRGNSYLAKAPGQFIFG
jgi:hypothetical protein